jgi:hypothetical protein
MTKDEALKMALEALLNHSGNYKLSKDECVKYLAVEDALREALVVRTWVSLTERELLDLFNVENSDSIDARIYLTAYNKIEAALKEKNA